MTGAGLAQITTYYYHYFNRIKDLSHLVDDILPQRTAEDGFRSYNPLPRLLGQYGLIGIAGYRTVEFGLVVRIFYLGPQTIASPITVRGY